uniref:C2H2-type domain-containing protein n=1 Tax=Anopheles culicifacies TaxID=139723 RepID=A0A182MAV9_9DIPT
MKVVEWHKALKEHIQLNHSGSPDGPRAKFSTDTAEPDDDDDDEEEEEDGNNMAEEDEHHVDPDAASSPPAVPPEPPVTSVVGGRASGDLVGSRLQAKCVSLLQLQQQKHQATKMLDDEPEDEEADVASGETPRDLLMASLAPQYVPVKFPYASRSMVISPSAQDGSSNSSSGPSLPTGGTVKDGDLAVYDCSQCPTTFASRDQLERHELHHPPSADAFRCKTTGVPRIPRLCGRVHSA